MRIWTALRMGKRLITRTCSTDSSAWLERRFLPGVVTGKNSLEDITDTTIRQGLKLVYYVMREIIMKTAVELSTVITLEPGESREMAFLAGMKEDNEAAEIIAHYADCEKTCAVELEELISYWHGQLAHFQIRTPSPEFDTMINTWNAYNCFMTFIWSRAASFTYCGLRNGYGYRDTVQDIQGVIHLAPQMALDKIRFMLSAQVDNGGGLPLVKFTHNPGHEDTPDDASYVQETGHPAYRADDALWLFPTVYKYISETGNLHHR